MSAGRCAELGLGCEPVPGRTEAMVVRAAELEPAQEFPRGIKYAGKARRPAPLTPCFCE